MKRNLRFLAAMLAVAGAACLLAGRGQAGGDKAAWQPMLSKEVYQELAQREVETIGKMLEGSPDDKMLGRARLGAVMIASYTLSVKDAGSAEELRGVRDGALQVAMLLNKQDGVAQAKKLLPDLLKRKPDGAKKTESPGWDMLLTKADLMDHLRVKDKGGDGMHADLQSNIRLKGALNGVEEKIRALSMKELNAAGMKKEAKELELLGYRMAALGSLTYYFAPKTKEGNKDPQEWRTLSLQTRDNGVSLAVAAQKGDSAGVFKAGSSLNSSCSQCHTVFRMQ